jgi:hypothetical protein
MNRLLALALVPVALAVASAPAYAQSRKLIGVGIGWSVERIQQRETWNGEPNWIIFRIPRPSRLGAAWSIGSETDEVRPADPLGTIGSLKMRHVLFGPGYTWRAGRVELTGSALVGPLFSRFEAAAGAPPELTVADDWSLAFRPDVTLWTDLTARWGVKLSANYLIARPNLTIDAAGVERTSEWNARRVRAQVGIVFGAY